MKPEKKKLALRLLLHTVILAVIYFLLANRGVPMHILYIGLGAILALIYIIYNRGLAWKNATEDMLPESMTHEEKQAFLKKNNDRLHASEWMLTVVFPIIVTLILDYAYLFFLPYLEGMLG